MPDLSTVVNMFFGADNSKVLYALIILVTLDYITGVCVAIKDKKLSSSIGAKGIINKVVIFIMVSLSHVVDSYLLSSGVALERITILFYCANEAISILENAGKIDTEGAEIVEEIMINGNSGLRIVKNGQTHIALANTDKNIFIDIFVRTRTR